MTSSNLRFRIFLLVVGIVLLVGGNFLIERGIRRLENKNQCHNQCSHGNQECQKRCNERTYCPYAESEK